MRKFISILLALFIIFNFNIYTYALPEAPKENPVTVKLNDELLKFEVDPILINGRAMVPMRAIFEELGSQVLWYEDTRTVVGYKDNMFIKLAIGATTAYKNGKGFPLDSPAIIKNGRALVPVRFIAESFGMVVSWDDATRTVLLRYDKTINPRKIVDNIIYKTIDVRDYGLKFMIPEYWSPVDNSSHEFEYSEDNSKVQMKVETVQFDKPKTLEEFTEENKAKILETHKSNVVFTGNSKMTVNNVNINVTHTKNTSVSPEIKQAIYYIVTEKQGYIITFSYYSESNDSQFLNIFTTIMNSLAITDRSIVYADEHYIEYDKFYELGMKFDSELYSNMDVQNKIDLKGSVKKGAAADYLFVQVSKDKNVLEQKISIKNNTFDGDINIPFGLGKHNIIIGTPLDENNTSEFIMQFSVINTSREDIRYLISSRFVEADDKEIITLSNEITKGLLNDYDKAKELFRWVSSNITYDQEASTTTPKSAKEVLTSKVGDCDEITYLYTALARAAGIPARIVSGKVGEELHAWNELMVNGKWIVADPTWGSGYIDEVNGSFVKELDMNYFNPTKQGYEKQFSDIKFLSY